MRFLLNSATFTSFKSNLILIQPRKISDAELAHLIKSGEKEAYRELFEKYAPKIYLFSLSYLKNEEDAKGLVQEVFMKVWEKREILDASQNIKSYIFKIAVNAIYDFIRHKNIENAFNDFARINFDIHSNDTWDTVIFEEMKSTLNKLVAQLPEQRRRIFNLSKRKGLSNDEIAIKLNISKRTVENQLYRAITFLKEHLRNESIIFLLFFYLWYY